MNSFQYARQDDFCRIFTEETAGLYQLSFLLTGDHSKAEQCFVGGLEDCVKANNVFREWARGWARRAIIKNAIRTVQPHPYDASVAAFSTGNKFSIIRDGHFTTDTLLALQDFERFVFVMSVLEHYPEQECAVLLDCSLQEIRNARNRALEQLAQPICTASVP